MWCNVWDLYSKHKSFGIFLCTIASFSGRGDVWVCTGSSVSVWSNVSSQCGHEVRSFYLRCHCDPGIKQIYSGLCAVTETTCRRLTQRALGAVVSRERPFQQFHGSRWGKCALNHKRRASGSLVFSLVSTSAIKVIQTTNDLLGGDTEWGHMPQYKQNKNK